MEQNMVNLGINKELITPIVEKEIKAAVVAALGGADSVIEKVVNNIMYQKVNSEGKVSSYSSDNKYTFIEHVLTNNIKGAIGEELKRQIGEKAEPLKKAIVKSLRNEKMADKLADALLTAFSQTVDSNWKSIINIEIKPITRY